MNGVGPRLPKRSRLGILAGNGIYPILLAKRLHENKIPFVVAGLRGQTRREYYNDAHAYTDLPIGAFGVAARFLQAHAANAVFFSGGVSRKGLLFQLRPDRVGLSLFVRGLWEGDDRFLTRCADIFFDLGIEVLDPAPLLSDMFANRGHLAGPAATNDTWTDFAAARAAALTLGAQDRGQAALAHRGKVIGLENRNGTDALLDSTARPGCVLVKMVKPGQDRRFDLPAIGEHTLSSAHRAGVRAIGVEENGVLLLQKSAVFSACDRFEISLYGLDAPVSPEG